MHSSARTLTRRILPPLLAAAFAASGLSACGGSGADGKVVATAGKGMITQAALNHWMATTVAGDYRELNSEDAPLGLTSDPPDYSRCVSAAKSIVTSSGAHTKLSDEQLILKCRELYAAVKEQTLSFLISALWSIEEGAEHGQSVSEAEITRTLSRIRSEEWPTPAQFKTYLTREQRSLSDERYLLKRNLLTEKSLSRLKRQAGGETSAFSKLVLANEAKWISRTRCEPGYRSTQCKQYASAKSVSPSAAILVEHLKAGT